jgi:hypothetical protein
VVLGSKMNRGSYACFADRQKVKLRSEKEKEKTDIENKKEMRSSFSVSEP